jgi:hypothetical protein
MNYLIKNKSIKLFYLFLFQTIHIHSQTFNHIEYKKECDIAYRYAFDSMMYAKSILKIKEIELKYNKIYGEEYMLVSYCYLKQEKLNKSARMYKKAWSNFAFDLNCLIQTAEFEQDCFFKNFNKRQIKIAKKGYKNGQKLKTALTDSLVLVFDNLNNLDQEPRLKLHNDTSKVFRKMVFQEMEIVDSLNMIEYKKIIYKHGYPGEYILPLNSTGAPFLLLVHSSGDKLFYNEMKDVLLNEVKIGHMPPSDYVLWLDRHNEYCGLPLEYGILDLPSQNKFSQTEKEEIYKKRLECGLIKQFPLPSKQLTFSPL